MVSENSTPSTTLAPVLHYIFDPMCGWCYGAAPLIAAAARYADVQLHAGGMMVGPRRQPVNAQLRQFVQTHDARIAALSGQPFGDGYRLGLLHDDTQVLDSAPPIAAILAAEQQAGKGLAMLAALQQAHYVQGRAIAMQATLVDIALHLGLDAAAFITKLAAIQTAAQGEPSPLDAHIAVTRRLMEQHGVDGFPSLILQQGATWQRIDVSRYLGQVERFDQYLQTQLQP